MAQLENFRLKVFRAVAEQLNFHMAAEHLFLTQPAVTLQIKALEKDLGVRLFDRAGGRVSLTREGSILLGYATKIANLTAEAEQELVCEEGKVSGHLSLGVSTTIAQYVLPRLLVAFVAEYPAVEVALHSGNTSQIVQLLLEGRVALGLIEGPSRDRGVRCELFMEDELVLITPPQFEFDHLSRNQFLASSLLMQEEGSGSRRVPRVSLSSNKVGRPPVAATPPGIYPGFVEAEGVSEGISSSISGGYLRYVTDVVCGAGRVEVLRGLTRCARRLFRSSFNCMVCVKGWSVETFYLGGGGGRNTEVLPLRLRSGSG